MPLIPFPNIPKLPGVPSLPRSPSFPTVAQAALGAIQGAIWRALQVQTQWGIYDAKGKPLGDPALFTGIAGALLESIGIGSTLSTSGVEFSKEAKVSDFPTEGGKFASYNKVEMPATPAVILCMAGSESNRNTFLNAIDKACKSTDLYSVVTPEVTYVGYTLERYNYIRHSDRGATLLVVELFLKEVRAVSALYTKSNKGKVGDTKSTSATPATDNGKIQPQQPETSTLKSLVKKFPALVDKVKGLF